MRKNFIRLLVLLGSITSLGACSNERGDCFLVNPLETGDSYKVKEFTEALGERIKKENPYYGAESVTLDVTNVMPHDIYDIYGAGLYTVRTKEDNQTYDDAYLYYNKLLFKVSPLTVRSNQDNFTFFGNVISVAFTDLNKDGSFEITVAYRYDNKNKISFLTTIDTMSLEQVGSSSIYDDISLKKESGKIALYKGAEKLGNFTPYTKLYEISAPNINVENANYKAVVTWDRFETKVPVNYPNLMHRFKVNVEMTYTGETFTYLGHYMGAEVSFASKDIKLKRMEIAYPTVVEECTIETGTVLKGTYYFYDEYQDENPLGIYDMEVSYRGEAKTVKEALTIK